MRKPERSETVRLGEFDVDFEAGELRKHGHKIKLQEKPFRILQILLERPGRVVSRETLFERLWPPDTFVDFDNSVNAAVNKLRAALRDPADEPKFIETLAGRGYRYIGPSDGLRRSRERKRLFVAGAFIAVAAAAFVFGRGGDRAPILALPPSEWVKLTDFTDSATSPALSPDGRMLTFLRGPGTFVTPGQVYVKLLPDGDAVQLTDDDSPKMSPRFSPDGNLIAYTTGPWNTWVVPVLGGPPRLLLANASGLSWLEDGRLLYSEVEAGWHMGIVSSTESRTESRLVYRPADELGMAHRSYISPDGKWILLAEMDGIGWSPCRLVPADGSSPGRSVGPPKAQCRSAAWSPDGRWMYLTTNAGGGFHIWRQGFPDGEPEPVTSGPTEVMGIAMAPDGRSVISSVGTEQSMLWFRDRTGERQVTSEGFAMFPRLSADGKKLYYLARSSESRAYVAGHLWEVDLESGRRERLLPDFIVAQYHISNDGERIVFVAMDSEERTHLWLAPLDRRRPPREVPSPAPFEAAFGGQGDLFVVEAEGSTRYLYRMREDGTDRRRVVPEPITGAVGAFRGGYIDVSPDNRWVLALMGRPGTEESQYTVKAYPAGGGEAAPICDDCWVEWGPGGKFLYVAYPGLAWTADVGIAVAIPIPSGEALPALPDNGLHSEGDALALPDVQIIEPIEMGSITPGPDPSIYAFIRATVQRNLYRIPLPR